MVPAKNCNEPLKAEMSSNFIQEYRQLLEKYSYLQFYLLKLALSINLIRVIRLLNTITVRPNPRDWSLYEEGNANSNCGRDFKGSLPDTPVPVKQSPKKCFQTDFKVEFRGVLQRTFAGIEAVKEFEVNFMRPVQPEEAFDVSGSCDILKRF